MSDLTDVTRLPDDFDGRVRLFPLPGLVVFPHAMQPLHVFEPRYCSMLADSLASDRLIAMGTIVTAADNPTSAPEIAPTVCIGKVISHAELEGDRHNVLLVGAKRARIIQEVDTGELYRSAIVEPLDDIYPPAGKSKRVELKGDLLAAFGSIIPPSANVQQNLHELMAGSMGLGPITDIISYTLPFTIADKLVLMGIQDVDRRAAELIDLLQSGSIQLHSLSAEEQTQTDDSPEDSDGRFPPPFSLN